MTTGKTIDTTRRTFVGKVMSLLFNMLSRLVITFLPRSKRLLISWLQSPSVVILEPKNHKCITLQFQRLKIQNQHTSRATHPLEAMWENPPSFFQLLVTISIPWFVATSLQSLPSSSHYFLCVRFLFCLLKGYLGPIQVI